MAASDLRQIQTNIRADNPRAVADAFNRIGATVEPTPSIKHTSGAEATNTRRITIQVTDQLPQKQAWGGAGWIAHVKISPTAGAAPDGTGNTVALVAGRCIETITPNAEWNFEADANGKVQLDLTVSGAATRHVSSETFGKLIGSGPIAWSA
jgi:hypothetical protein